jgi:hypothetical protein
MDEFKDVAWLTVLRQKKEKGLKEMVETRRLPVLQDVESVNLEGIYGIKGSRSWRVFNRSGCVVGDSLGTRLEGEAKIEPLLEMLRNVDR